MEKQPPKFIKKKILMVDDDEYMRIFFKDIFWLHGLDEKFDLNTVGTIEDAEAILDNPDYRPVIVFLDLVMKMKNDGRAATSPEAGMSILRKIKNDPELKDIKVVVLSSYPVEEYESKVKKIGADMYLQKSESLPRNFVDILNMMYGGLQENDSVFKHDAHSTV